jgi:hypothetical protein
MMTPVYHRAVADWKRYDCSIGLNAARSDVSVRYKICSTENATHSLKRCSGPTFSLNTTSAFFFYLPLITMVIFSSLTKRLRTSQASQVYISRRLQQLVEKRLSLFQKNNITRYDKRHTTARQAAQKARESGERRQQSIARSQFLKASPWNSIKEQLGKCTTTAIDEEK